MPWPANSPKIALADGTSAVAVKPRQPEPSTATVLLPPVKPVRTAAARPTSGGGPEVRAAASRSLGLLVEAAVLEGRDDADRLGAIVRTLGSVAVEAERRGGRMVYAVRIGPVASNDEAATILAQLNRAGLTGVADHRSGIPLKTP